MSLEKFSLIEPEKLNFRKDMSMMAVVIKSGNTNCYLLSIGNNIILIDAGTNADKQFLYNLKAQVDLDKIDLLILTHGHYDHVGYAATLQKEHGTAIAIHKNDFEKIITGSMDFPPAKGFCSNLIRKTTLTKTNKAVYTPFAPDIVIENETIDGYRDIEIMLLPGHTSGSIGVIWENNLFAGDSVMNMPIPSKSWFAEDFYLLEQSIRKMQKRNLNMIYPGHGSGFSSKWLNHITLR